MLGLKSYLLHTIREEETLFFLSPAALVFSFSEKGKRKESAQTRALFTSRQMQLLPTNELLRAEHAEIKRNKNTNMFVRRG